LISERYSDPYIHPLHLVRPQDRDVRPLRARLATDSTTSSIISRCQPEIDNGFWQIKTATARKLCAPHGPPRHVYYRIVKFDGFYSKSTETSPDAGKSGRAQRQRGHSTPNQRTTLMPVLKRVKCPPLTKVTGERPKCQNCKKPLKARTFWVEIAGHISQAPSSGELAVRKQPPSAWPDASEAIKAGYDAARVYRIEHLETWKKESSTKLYFWRGYYEGYGTPPLFCSLTCGVAFAVACWHAGMRIKETPSHPVTSTPTTPS